MNRKNRQFYEIRTAAQGILYQSIENGRKTLRFPSVASSSINIDQDSYWSVSI